ncbi:hypothetical protein ACLXBB_36655, partial [Pseudomonas aeruginosa]
RPSLPSEPQPPEEFDERVERFSSTRAFLAARDAYRQERRRWIAAHDAWRERVADLEAAADAEYRRRRDVRRCRPSRSRRKSSTSAWSVFPVPVRSLRRATP